jgi:hypothetical protein
MVNGAKQKTKRKTSLAANMVTAGTQCENTD